ncbi:ComEA family DNA-binding protein [Maribacter sp. ACAM166]|uniref:ComEA family DNA-binding protein n=1 Tax=Maribacter sp. ACAM166 TaxID=2508996 RepID=UPI0010FE7960|nr:helix-hairpin-helix domain-containing protein [Maribacter sp. ACAM166]TLP81046.1 helix-hairpin-helix domain-containing protein [Maribacter sp. ACAM166]
MKNIKSHFKFNKQERSGIFFLLFILITIQLGYFLYNANKFNESYPLTLNEVDQHKIDSLKQASIKNNTIKIYPFNPNFISDYKGYTLGMSIAEIDRLHDFRASEKFVNSAEEFQKVTSVSDSLLKFISPYFKFPEWTKRPTYKFNKNSIVKKGRFIPKSVEWIDLNSASAEELQRVSGIGEKLSARIIKFRNRLGGFLVDDQLYEVYGLDEEVVKRALNQFKVVSKPEIIKINVNTATAEELSKLIYLQKEVALRIVNYRNLNGSINSLSELINIEGFPPERIERIGLYLSL